MRLRVLQHVAFEGPAGIAGWAAARGVPMKTTHLFKGDPLPSVDEFDLLAIMGGPMSVNDGELFSWLAPEIALVRTAIAANKLVLGVCLGAQLIAKALGANIYAARDKEIGWFPVRKTVSASPFLDGIPAEFMAFHWHGETFELPKDALKLAETDAIPNQAFAFGRRVLALQFHLEATAESVKLLIENAAGDIGDGPFEQNQGMILAGLHHCPTLGKNLDRVLDNLTGLGHGGT